MKIKKCFAEALGCGNMREVSEKAANWNFNLPEDQHLIRSAILSLHANIEDILKHILFHHMVRLISEDAYHPQDETHIQTLIDNIKRLSFSTVLNLLQPCLDAWDNEPLKCLKDINRVRNDAAHRDPDHTLYKGRNPFKDYDALAELLSDTIYAHAELGEFFIQKIGLPPDGLLREV
ncbi:MAG: hypothetical protein ACYC56_05565 [Candidatus Aquicultor sp.]